MYYRYTLQKEVYATRMFLFKRKITYVEKYFLN